MGAQHAAGDSDGSDDSLATAASRADDAEDSGPRRRPGAWVGSGSDPAPAADSSVRPSQAPPADAPPRRPSIAPPEGRSERFEGSRDRPSDWGSLVADLSNGTDDPRWRVHDRTHLEFAVRYPVQHADKVAAHEWEAYFFVPESLRLDSATYSKSDIYADLQSYVRFAVPEVAFADLTGGPLTRLSRAMHDPEPERVTRELRLFACAVRAAAVARQRTIADALKDPDKHDAALAAVWQMVGDAERITEALREELRAHPGADDTRQTAARWVDEDVSRLLEMIFGGLSVKLRKAKAPQDLQDAVVAAAVREARYRDSAGLEGVGHSNASKRETEHLEFRRHVLKRFTSSVLWLTPEVRQGARLVLQALYAVAAGVAMAFAVTAALWNGAPQFSNTTALWMWSAVAVIAYMGKDRIKALLQSTFSKLVSKHLPDRRWWIRGPQKRRVLGKVDEITGFVDFNSLPEPVLAKRRSTRRHPLEEVSRPEKVLWHRKTVRLDPRQVQAVDPRFDALTEIFRLDLRRWLAHTDDPKRRIHFAAPDTGEVCSAMAPRVYNIGVVYRLHNETDEGRPVASDPRGRQPQGHPAHRHHRRRRSCVLSPRLPSISG